MSTLPINGTKSRPYIPWRAGLFGGLACPALLIVILLSNYYLNFLGEVERGESSILLLVVAILCLLPLLIAITWVALRGDANRNFYQVQLTGFIGCTILILSYLSAIFYFQGTVEATAIIDLFPVLLLAYAVMAIASTFIWFILGRRANN